MQEIVLRCDKCGCEISKEKGVGLQVTFFEKIDFCEKCNKKFKEWLKE